MNRRQFNTTLGGSLVALQLAWLGGCDRSQVPPALAIDITHPDARAALDAAAREAMEVPWLTDAERTAMRVFHGQWTSDDLGDPAGAAMVAAVRYTPPISSSLRGWAMISGTTPSSMSTASASSTIAACRPGTSGDNPAAWGPRPERMIAWRPFHGVLSRPMRSWSRSQSAVICLGVPYTMCRAYTPARSAGGISWVIAPTVSPQRV